MSNSLILTHSVGGGGKSRTLSKEFQGQLLVSLDIEVADSVTDQQHDIDLDVSQIQAIFIGSDQNVVLEINDPTTPDKTINLEANKAYVWFENLAGVANPFSNDWTAIYVTNASGSTAKITIEAVVDSTP